ncbi:carboxypeptidase regulatory-like domain-containing protein [Maricurvus nonylphenolicus]|uniref:Vgb family protein n=1 Tax=Maricurvus nonylphenolicus TaxID=1008307 RepID=UPI0036F225EA
MRNIRQTIIGGMTCLLLPLTSIANTITVVDAKGEPLSNVMVLQAPLVGHTLDTSDMGYPPERKEHFTDAAYTLFTDDSGQVSFSTYPDRDVRIRLRKPDYQDVTFELKAGQDQQATLETITDPLALAESRPANTWLAEMSLDNDPELKKHYIMQCGFCHQQGSHFFRRPRPQENWQDVIYRMVGYGSRLHDQAQEQLPQLLFEEYSRLYSNPEIIPAGTPWAPHLQQTRVTEWPIGDAFSQMHDLLVHSNGLIYVGDNLQDRLYEIDPNTGKFVIYKLKRENHDKHGGLMGKRLESFPKHETFAGIHSFAESPKDGHIFITTSYQQRLVEFDPVTKEFINHHMDEGYYPHTVRIDAQDRVWFTMALSNQVAMFNRQDKSFQMFDLPARSKREELTVGSMGIILKLMDWGIPLANWFSIDEQSTGVPLPYGIEITPNGDIWFARLHADSIGKIDAKTLEVSMYETPFVGPRRLRSDSKGNLWIAAFPESMVVKFDPKTETFHNFPLPVQPLGSETPYSLNVDRKRDIVWVNGNTSDALYSYDIDQDHWSHYPLPKRVTFTRDVEITPQGDVYTTSASFPSWHIEDAQPTLIHIQPNYQEGKDTQPNVVAAEAN